MVERGTVGEAASPFMPGAYEPSLGARQEVANMPGIFAPITAFMGPDLP
jgi:hypothetical protein